MSSDEDRRAYEDALKRVSEAQDQWERVRLPIEPLGSGPVPTVPPAQLAAEAELGAAWAAYEVARDRFYGRGG